MAWMPPPCAANTVDCRCVNIGGMAATNDTGKGKAIFKAALPFLVILIVLLFVFFIWHYYHPHGTIDIHQTHVSLLLQNLASPRLSATFA